MTLDVDALIAEREQQIARLRDLYRFSQIEAEDFLERFGVEPAEPMPIHEGQAA